MATITTASLTSTDGKETIKGRVAGGKWIATQRLEPGTDYTLTVTGKGEDGKDKTLTRTFSTQKLHLGPADLPVGGAARGRDRRRRHAGHRHVRRAGQEP